jgi:hypothetical protein
MLQLQCISYRIPLEEINRARQGTPIQELAKLTEPEIFIPKEEIPLRPKRGRHGKFE